MEQRNFVQTREFDSPFEKGSLFHNYYDDPIGATSPEDETPTEDKFTYTIIPCESGLEVFEKYIFFAESCSELFVYDKEQKEYQCIDRYNTDNIIQEFSSFDDMLLYILKLMLYEEVD